jgi:hypothetical protein
VGRVWAAVVVAAVVACAAIVPPRVAAAAAQADPEVAAAGELVGYVPAAERYRCSLLDLDLTLEEFRVEAASISASVTCGPDGPAATVDYYRFTNAEAMNRVYASVIGDAGSEPERSEGGKCPSDAHWTLNDVTVGKVGCYYGTQADSGDSVDETVARIWTYDEANILGYARGPIGDVDATALRQWWTDDAGPQARPDDVPELASPDGPRARRRLLRRIPATTRKGCKVADLTDPAEVGDATLARIWISVLVRCPVDRSGIDHVEYYLVDPKVVDDHFDPTYRNPDRVPEGGCRKDLDWRPEGVKRSEPATGTVTCFHIATDSGDVATLAWSDREQGIISQVFATDDDAAPLYKWWRSSDSGPTSS